MVKKRTENVKWTSV